MSTTSVGQLEMPGLSAPVRARAGVSSATVCRGQGVLYLGTVTGGPRYGAAGIVKGTLRRRAVVDMGRSGTWHIPYHFLAHAK